MPATETKDLSNLDITALQHCLDHLWPMTLFSTNTKFKNGTTCSSEEIKEIRNTWYRMVGIYRSKIQDIINVPLAPEIEEANKNLKESEASLKQAKEKLLEASQAVAAVADFAAIIDVVLDLALPVL